MWLSRTKNDLIIEVWEKLDCESVGAAEIEAIEIVINDQYGESAVESPMVTARLLAGEGAVLRHSEIMGLYLERASERPYDAALQSINNIHDLRTASDAIYRLENLRKKYLSENDKAGLRLVREKGIESKQAAVESSQKEKIDPVTRHINAEIAQWFTVWLQTPDVFEHWVALRQTSAEFIERFGRIGGPNN